MRALVARSVRPRIRSTGTISLPSTSLPARQAAFPPTRRKLTFNDAFTILLAPVFTIAVIADATLKDRRKKSWDQKIAGVREEIESIHERELQAWQNIQLRSVRAGINSQRRAYSTAAREAAIEREEEDLPEHGTMLNEINTGNLVDLPAENAATEQKVRITKHDVSPRSAQYLTPEAFAKWQQFEMLLASKLALELLLHIRTGKSWLYREPISILLDPEQFPESLDGLSSQLRQVNESLGLMKYRKGQGAVPNRLLVLPARQALQDRIADLADSCRKGNITVIDLVYNYARAITVSKVAPTSEAYRKMILTFSTLDNDNLAYITLGALRNCRQRLNHKAIRIMIRQYGRYKDASGLSKLLWNIARKDDGNSLKLVNQWEYINFNGVRLSVPCDRDSKTLSTTVRAALQCGMIRYAEAWTMLLTRTGSTDELGRVIRHVITYYTEEADWTYGSRWLKESIKHMAAIAAGSTVEVSRNIIRMLELCVACDQVEMYENILGAAVAASIEPEEVNVNIPEHFSERIASIRQDWAARLNPTNDKPAQYSDGVAQFQRNFAKHDHTMAPYVGIVDPRKIAEIVLAVPGKSEGKFRPFHSPEKVLLGIEIHPGRNDPQIRIAELEAQLIESKKENADLLEKLSQPDKKAGKPINKIEDDSNLTSDSSQQQHLLAEHQELVRHITRDHQKTVLDLNKLREEYDILYANHERLKTRVQRNMRQIETQRQEGLKTKGSKPTVRQKTMASDAELEGPQFVPLPRLQKIDI